MRRWLSLLAFLVPVGAACSSNDAAPPAADAGPVEPSCDPGVAPPNAACNPSSSIVCNVAGASVTCCPAEAPYFCPATNNCYGALADAFHACGAQPHACIACPSPQADAGTDASADANADEDANGDANANEDATSDDSGNPIDTGADAAADAAADAVADAGADAADAAAVD